MSGSGKTTLAHKLKDALGDDIVLLCHDFYYKAHDDMPFEERQKLNFDQCRMRSILQGLLIEDIRALERGDRILRPVCFPSQNAPVFPSVSGLIRPGS